MLIHADLEELLTLFATAGILGGTVAAVGSVISILAPTLSPEIIILIALCLMFLCGSSIPFLLRRR